MDLSHIICLGMDAWSKFDPTVEKPTSRLHGKILVHYLYHPSYIQKQPKSVRDVYVDLIANIIEESRIRE